MSPIPFFVTANQPFVTDTYWTMMMTPTVWLTPPEVATTFTVDVPVGVPPGLTVCPLLQPEIPRPINNAVTAMPSDSAPR